MSVQFQNLFGPCTSCWNDLFEVLSLINHFDESEGLFGLELDAIGTLRGSIHIVLAAQVFNSEQQKTILGALDCLNSFSTHLFNHHPDESFLGGISSDLLHQWKEPLYMGDFELEDFLRMSARLRGKTCTEADEFFQHELKDVLDTCKAGIAKLHGLRRSVVCGSIY